MPSLPPALRSRAAANCSSTPEQIRTRPPKPQPDNRPAAHPAISRSRARKSPVSHTGPTTSAIIAPLPRHLPQRQNVVMRLVERRPYQIVHRGIHHHEFFRRRLLPVQHARQQHARRTHNRPPRLDHHLQPGIRQSARAGPKRNRECPARSRPAGTQCRVRRPGRHDQSLCPSARSVSISFSTLPAASRIDE